MALARLFADARLEARLHELTHEQLVPLAGELGDRTSAEERQLLMHAELVTLTAELARTSAETRRKADEALVRLRPLSAWLHDRVFGSEDLLPKLLAWLELEHRAAMAACTGWKAAWLESSATRRMLRPAGGFAPRVLPYHVEDMVELPGERLCTTDVLGKVRVLDKELHQLRTLEHNGTGLAVGSDRLFTSDMSTRSLRSYKLDDLSVLVERSFRTFAMDIDYLALAPGNLLFAIGQRVEEDQDDWHVFAIDGFRVFAVDAITLAHRFTFGNFDDEVNALAVVGDELFVGSEEGIHVFSFAGEPLRVMRGDLGQPQRLRFINDRLYVTVVSGDVKAMQKIHVLTPEGETLQVYDCAPHLREGRGLGSIVCFDGKLLVTGYTFGHNVDVFDSFVVDFFVLCGL